MNEKPAAEITQCPGCGKAYDAGYRAGVKAMRDAANYALYTNVDTIQVNSMVYTRVDEAMAMIKEIAEQLLKENE